MGVSDNVFRFMLGGLAVKSFIDVGCGKGFSSKFFLDSGAKVRCVEGSHDAVTQSLLPSNLVIEHDFSRGPWWPAGTFDAAWAVEFLEHEVDSIVTASGFDGWHHVEVHGQWWWKSRMATQGFLYSRDLSQEVRKYAMAVRNESLMGYAQHLVHSMMVFINPIVANMPQHKHLIGGNGCYGGKVDNNNGGKPCEGPDKLPPEYEALLKCYVERKVTWKCIKNENAVPVL
eukprot:CAMPEP_0175027994 /NCGR_PEP_ID=MMETSP0005-20121125/18718_1 /TAXON_ID=420556 /ORGANISM="Ochromonas sp., Strain CCMP1393" /LENGTH=228 /DNA_ID=CAMNT_0016287493 /DNA_START=118 /DNA_END=805 /DNA_ORIENTATION=-